MSDEENIFDPTLLTPQDKRELLLIARKHIESAWNTQEEEIQQIIASSHLPYTQKAALFVTLTKQGDLRGCIGHVKPYFSLQEALFHLSYAAAFEDPRFPPVREEEMKSVLVELSLLSPLQKVKDHRDIHIPGHGVMVKKGFHEGVFLPQVADETGWTKEEFLKHLCAEKAGLMADAWKQTDTQLYIFTVVKFQEGEQ